MYLAIPLNQAKISHPLAIFIYLFLFLLERSTIQTWHDWVDELFGFRQQPREKDIDVECLNVESIKKKTKKKKKQNDILYSKWGVPKYCMGLMK